MFFKMGIVVLETIKFYLMGKRFEKFYLYWLAWWNLRWIFASTFGQETFSGDTNSSTEGVKVSMRKSFLLLLFRVLLMAISNFTILILTSKKVKIAKNPNWCIIILTDCELIMRFSGANYQKTKSHGLTTIWQFESIRMKW